MPSLYERQTTISTCVATCMTSGDLDGCTSLLEYSCICRSAAYQSSAAECWEGCPPEEVAIGQMFSSQRCAAVGVTISTSAISNIGGPTPTASTPASITSVTISGTPESWLEAPVLYKQTLVNIQAIMSSICASLFILAIILGVLSCRNRIKRERGQTSSQWSAGGTFGDQTKHDPTASRFTAAGSRAHLNARSQTDTFMSGLSAYGQTVSFSAPMPMPMVPSDRPRFTNRMAVEEEDEEEEEWEMKDRKESQELELDLEEVKTPTTATSSHNHHHFEEDGMGSTVALNQVNLLDKGREI